MTVRGRCAFRSTVLAALAMSCLLSPASAQTRGGTLTIGVEQQVLGFDPVVTKTTAYVTVLLRWRTRPDRGHSPRQSLDQSPGRPIIRRLSRA
jgi:hypothetical protein